MSHLAPASAPATLLSRLAALLLGGLLLGGCTQDIDAGNDVDAPDDEPVACESFSQGAFDAMDEACAVGGEQCILWGDEVNTASLVCTDGTWTYRVTTVSAAPCPDELPEEGSSCTTGQPSQFGPLECSYGDITAVCEPWSSGWIHQ